MLRSIVPAVCACALLATPAAARATTYEDACAKAGDVVSGQVADISHASRDPQGHAITPDTAVEHPKRAARKVYATTQDSVLRFDGATYDVRAQTIFQLACSGEAGSSKLTDPTFSVIYGEATLHARKGHVEGIDGRDGAAYNFDTKEMDIRISRTVKDADTYQEVLDAPAKSDFGTLTLHQSGGGYAAVTPYIGTKRSTNGQCHYVHGAVITSTGRTRRGATKGTVEWEGLAPFSPR